MYLIINEEGALSAQSELTKADFESHEHGLIDIVVKDEEGFKQYWDGEFHLIGSGAR